jgi:hypothetical protein
MATGAKRDNLMDIDALIDKVNKLPIPDIEKADLLRKFKENMMNPDRGEMENLNRIQSKYSSLYPIGSSISVPSMAPSIMPSGELIPSINPAYNQMTPSMTSSMMTTAHFEVLKNKMDSIQLELVDLLRHVKDYTQRYMNATRQQDMEKIDAYINGLFEVDKQMKRAEEQAAMMSADEEAEAAAAGPEKSAITRATDGIKNFLGGIGEGVSGITSFVSSTANIVNDTLSKKVIGGTTPTTASSTTSANTTTKTAPKAVPAPATNNRGNVVSVSDYIQSNMNQVDSGSTTAYTSTPISGSSANANNITSSNNINAMAKPIVKNPSKIETAEGNQEEITAAINKLNDTMNADIDNTVKKGQAVVNAQPGESQAGGARENHLTRKIRMLRLRITKRKLEEQLLDKKTEKTKNNMFIKRNSKKTIKKTTKNARK